MITSEVSLRRCERASKPSSTDPPLPVFRALSGRAVQQARRREAAPHAGLSTDDVLAIMVGFRNVAVHDDQALNLDVVWAAATDGMSDLATFARRTIGQDAL